MSAQGHRPSTEGRAEQEIPDYRPDVPAVERFIPFGEPLIGEEEIAEVVETLRSGWIGTGPKVEQFEREFASYIGCRDAVAVSSCTAGLHLSLLVSGVSPGNEVITTTMTFAATVNVIVHVGAVPILVDIDERTLNLTADQIKQAVTPRTKAVIPVHFGGLPCDLSAINELAAHYGLAVIEDSAHALGGRYGGKLIGSSGNLACFSFYPNKNITTIEGGMITLDDPELAEKLRIWRLHGLGTDAWERYRSKRLILSEILYPGFKYNMTDVQASLGIHQLRNIEQFLAIRESYAEILDTTLDPFIRAGYVRTQPRPPAGSQDRHALHLYVVLINPARFKVNRDRIVEALRAENIGAGMHYRAIHLHPYYRELFREWSFPVANQVSEATLTLPLSPKLSRGEMESVARGLERVLNFFAL